VGGAVADQGRFAVGRRYRPAELYVGRNYLSKQTVTIMQQVS
jgi:hypothetical protein